MNRLAVCVVGLVLSAPPLLSCQGRSPQLCVAPASGTKPERCAPGLCGGGELALQVDNEPQTQWPKSGSIEIGGLNAEVTHRIVVYRGKKPQQSFKFRFSEYKTDRLCLFLNDLYWTAQLWETDRAPWCKCR